MVVNKFTDLFINIYYQFIPKTVITVRSEDQTLDEHRNSEIL